MDHQRYGQGILGFLFLLGVIVYSFALFVLGWRVPAPRAAAAQSGGWWAALRVPVPVVGRRRNGYGWAGGAW